MVKKLNILQIKGGFLIVVCVLQSVLMKADGVFDFIHAAIFFLGIIFNIKLPLFWLMVLSLFRQQVPYSIQYHGLMPTNRSISFNLESRWYQLANTLAALLRNIHDPWSYLGSQMLIFSQAHVPVPNIN